jgi:asparagine synthase (glutamine-hydrolysing)
MCGLLGLVSRGPVDPARLDAVELLRHRGPDGEGRHVADGIGLAMRRLAIIDLETGDQPVTNEAGDVVCVVNGELYNYRELRAELAAKGHEFRTQGDVEVVPHLYEEHGEACFDRLRGMFAAAVWDGRAGRLLLARDRFGIKPLYLAELGGELAFSSELAPLLALGAGDAPDGEALTAYLALGYVPAPATGIAGIRRLAPGHVLVHEAGTTSERPYWELEPRAPADLEATLAEAVRLHLRSDVPLAVLLSGGLDSSLIAALAADEVEEPLRTFTVGFADAALDERAYARAVAGAVGSRHEELVVDTQVADDLPEIAARLEQPLADEAAIPLWYLCRAVAGEVKVALAGDGGDEVFGGYSRYAWDAKAARLGRVLPAAALARLLGRLPWGAGRKSLGRRAVKLLRHASKPEAERYFSWFALVDDDSAAAVFERLFATAPAGLTALGRLQHVDLASFLADDLMLKADKLSMAHSLELRVPFLDHRVVEAGLGLPDREKVRGVRTKVAIRRLVDERLPREVARRPKQGFDPPLERWLRGDLRDLAGDALGGLDGPVDAAAAKELLARFQRGDAPGAAPRLYSLLMLSLWRSGLRQPRADAVRL